MLHGHKFWKVPQQFPSRLPARQKADWTADIFAWVSQLDLVKERCGEPWIVVLDVAATTHVLNALVTRCEAHCLLQYFLYVRLDGIRLACNGIDELLRLIRLFDARIVGAFFLICARNWIMLM